jgi:pimeloyl-ACP methyl ester carboxylesterase
MHMGRGALSLRRRTPRRRTRFVGAAALMTVATLVGTETTALAQPQLQPQPQPPAQLQTQPPPQRIINWQPCAKDATAECGSLTLPVDWAEPHGETFALAVARRKATGGPGARVGSLVFGPGGPGDSGVHRIVNGMNRFSDKLRSRFDIVSFDPRGVGGSNVLRCSAELLKKQPPPVLTSQADYDATVKFNRELRADCRRNTGPVFDHLDTLSAVRDLDALRSALGESKLTFHGSSYGTLLGQQYAEEFPDRVRALVLESVMDHSLGTRDFLATQAVTVQDSFNEFVAWNARTPDSPLHGRDVRALWAAALARAERGEVAHPDDPTRTATPYDVRFWTERQFKGPNWGEVAAELKKMNSASARAAQPVKPAQPQQPMATVEAPPFEIFCQDWSLPVRNYREYARELKGVARLAPDLRYPSSMFIISSCLGSEQPVRNPQHRLDVPRRTPTILLTNALHDPATGHAWATGVAGQLGGGAALLTYRGWGHGTYTSSPCARHRIDRYLISRTVPSRRSSCPAVAPQD